MNVLGIDPGLDGALVVYALGRIVEQRCTRDLCPDGYVPEQMDGLVGQWCSDHGVTVAVLERVASRPGQGVASMFKLGYGVGLWRGILAGRVQTVIEPTPQAWQKVVLRDIPGEGKARAVARAAQVAGLDLTPGRRRKPHDGLADATCLAIYGGSR
jgi:crossover junction endodeoxyribonuclease RuvC